MIYTYYIEIQSAPQILVKKRNSYSQALFSRVRPFVELNKVECVYPIIQNNSRIANRTRGLPTIPCRSGQEDSLWCGWWQSHKCWIFQEGRYKMHRKCMNTISFAYETEVLHTYISGLSKNNILLSETEHGSASHLLPGLCIQSRSSPWPDFHSRGLQNRSCDGASRAGWDDTDSWDRKETKVWKRRSTTNTITL